MCHFGLRNQCSKHSECDYITDGMCCFDGCRRRCATPKGFPSRIEGICRATSETEMAYSVKFELELNSRGGSRPPDNVEFTEDGKDTFQEL